MKVKFKIASFSEEGMLTLLSVEFDTYEEAEKALKELLPGIYQIQKVFIKE